MSKKVFGIDVKNLVLIGKGVEGKVYRTPDNKALKVYKSISICNSKYKILKKYEDNKHFPNVYECKGYYMLREYIDGTPLREYIMDHGLSETLALNLVNLAEDFYNIRNVKLDGLNKHVLVLKDESVKIIDPRKRYYRFHLSLLSSLEKVGAYDKFVRILYREKPELAEKWLDYKTLKSLKPVSESVDSENELSNVTESKIDDTALQENINEEDFEIIDPVEIELESGEPIEIELEGIESIEIEIDDVELEELELETAEQIEIEPDTLYPTVDESETIEPANEMHEKENFELQPDNIQIEFEEENLEVVDSKRAADMAIKKINTANYSGGLEETIAKKCKPNYKFKILKKDSLNNIKLSINAKPNNEAHIK